METYAFAGITVQIKQHAELTNRLGFVTAAVAGMQHLADMTMPTGTPTHFGLSHHSAHYLNNIQQAETTTAPAWQYPHLLPASLSQPHISDSFSQVNEIPCVDVYIPALAETDQSLEQAVSGLIDLVSITFEEQLLHVDAVVISRNTSYQQRMTRSLYNHASTRKSM